jgi:hypothetical protein
MSNIVEKYVDKTYVINIERRKDRKASATNNLKKIDYDNYEFFNAYCKESTNVPKEYIEKTNIENFVMSGWFGYTFSHLCQGLNP